MSNNVTLHYGVNTVSKTRGLANATSWEHGDRSAWQHWEDAQLLVLSILFQLLMMGL